MEDSVIESFDGCLIIFRNVKEFYLSKQPITCYFSTKENFDHNDCFIGLFHVGWDTLESCISKKNLSLSEPHLPEKSQYCLHFTVDELPDPDIDEFYQFCFFNIKTDVVYGASCPFQIFDAAKFESFVEVDTLAEEDDVAGNGKWWIQHNPIDEDIEDSVLVHNKTTMLEDTLAMKIEENEELKALSTSCEMQIKALLAKIKCFEVTTTTDKVIITDLTNRIQFLENKKNLLQISLDESQATIRDELLTEFEKQLSKEHNIIETLKQKSNTVIQEKEMLLTKVEELVQIDDQKSELISQKNKKLDDTSEELENVKSALSIEKKQYQSLERSYQKVVVSLTSQNTDLGKKQDLVGEWQLKYNRLEKKLKHEESVNNQFASEVDNLTQRLTKQEKELEQKSAECKRLFNQLKYFSDMSKNYKEETEDLKSQLDTAESKFDELNSEEKTTTDEINANLLQLKLQLNCDSDKYESEKKLFQETLHIKSVYVHELEEVVGNMKTEINKLEGDVEGEKNMAARIIDELKEKQNELINEIKLLKESNYSIDVGARHALQVANSHMQKQLKSLKKENDSYQKLYSHQHNYVATDDVNELNRTNEELKLRLCMGKTAYEEKYRECQNLKSQLIKKQRERNELSEKSDRMNPDVGNTSQLPYTNPETERLKKTFLHLQQELKDCKEHEQMLFQELEELKVKNVRLIEHYDGRLKLLEEENLVIRKQKDALLRTEMSHAIRKDRVVQEQPGSNCETVIYHPPSSEEFIVQRQPDIILYPPSFKGKQVNAEVGAVTGVKKKPDREKSANKGKTEPSIQTICYRERNKAANSIEICNGKANKQPLFACPVCEMDFPLGISDTNAAAHVNSHFNDAR